MTPLSQSYLGRPSWSADGKRPAGYVRVIDLALSLTETIETIQPLLKIPDRLSHLEAIMRLQSEKAEIACVVNDADETIGVLYAAKLTGSLAKE